MSSVGKYTLATSSDVSMKRKHSDGSPRHDKPMKKKRERSGDSSPSKKYASMKDWKDKSDDSSSSSSSSVSSKLARQKSKAGSDEWANTYEPTKRKKAMIKGLDKIFGMVQREDNFNHFGNDAIQCFYDVATVCGDPFRRRALLYVEQLANRYVHEEAHRGWYIGDKPTPGEVIESIIGMYCLERLGLRPNHKPDVLKFMQLAYGEGGYNVKDYLRWDPRTEPPPKNLLDETGEEGDTVSRWRTLSNTLIHLFYAERVGASLGASYAQAFNWLTCVRPYKGPAGMEWQEYIDQAYLITHIIFTLNNWGELMLDPALLPHEYYFIREHMPIMVSQGDSHLVGEFVECLVIYE